MSNQGVNQTEAELPVITFSNKKHMDRDTVRRIRSHAMHKVQHRKYMQRISSTNSLGKMNQPLRELFHDGTLADSARMGECFADKLKDVQPAPDDRQDLVRRRGGRTKNLGCQSRAPPSPVVLPSSSPLTWRFAIDPFDAFPTQVDAKILSLFTVCYDRWKCDLPKLQFIRGTLSNPVFFHSFAAVWLHLMNDNATVVSYHERATLEHVTKRLQMLNRRSEQAQTSSLNDVVLSMSRMAMVQVTRGRSSASLQHIKGIEIVLSHNGNSSDDEGRTSLGSLLLSHYLTWDQIPLSLRHPFGYLTHAALQEVETFGFRVPSNSLLRSTTIRRILPARLLDISLALAALCAAADFRCSPAAEKRPRYLARESVKLGLRLVYMGDISIRADIKSRALVESIRLTCLIFIWGFSRKVSRTFSAMATCHARVQTLLQDYYSGSATLERDSLSKSLLLWQLMVLGATASSKTQMARYAGFVSEHLHESLKRSFQDVEAECCRIIWLRFPSPSQAEEFWNHVKKFASK